MRIIACEQRTDLWHACRLGRLTGSAAKDAIATIKTGEAAGRRDLRTRLVIERLTGQSGEDDYVNAAMQWGTDHEPEARAAFESLTGELVTETGFCQHEDLMAGCSLDGHLGDMRELVSLKCPKSATHLGYLKSPERMPATHVAQMLHELWITGARAYHFLSYDPRFPEGLQTYYFRVERDDAAVSEYAAKAEQFLRECDDEVATVRGLMAGRV